MENWLRCTITPGQFSEYEFAVDGQQSNGNGFSLFVPKEQVERDEEPTRSHAVEGWLPVEIWDQKEDRVLVRLPREAFGTGYFVTVKAADVRSIPLPKEMTSVS